ncbi:SGNH/GDSL hydrolase family protein, partial [Salmonella enterica subsp. enterica serovar Paratyphi A]
IGGNDINGALLQGKSIKETKSLVPSMVQAKKNAVRTVVSYGAVRVVVPGNFPIGCFPIYLTRFKTNNSTAYDEHKCLKDLNELTKFQNEQLRQGIRELKKEFPNVVITYGDYYKAFEWLYNNADYLGFDTSTKQKACCGSGGDYNFNLTRQCGADPDVPVCQNPNQLISWDGIHLTQEAYKHM